MNIRHRSLTAAVLLIGVATPRISAAQQLERAVDDRRSTVVTVVQSAPTPSAAATQISLPSALQLETSTEGTRVTGRIGLRVGEGFSLSLGVFATQDKNKNFATLFNDGSAVPDGLGASFQLNFTRIGDTSAYLDQINSILPPAGAVPRAPDANDPRVQTVLSRLEREVRPTVFSIGGSIQNYASSYFNPASSYAKTAETLVGWSANLGISQFVTQSLVLAVSASARFTPETGDAVAICQPMLAMGMLPPAFTCRTGRVAPMTRLWRQELRAEARYQHNFARQDFVLWINPAVTARFENAGADNAATPQDETSWGFRRLTFELGIYGRFGGTKGLFFGMTPGFHGTSAGAFEADFSLVLGGTFSLVGS